MFRKLAGLMAIAGLFVAGTASAAITGSAHDFTNGDFNTGGEICQVCHTPHNDTSGVADAPLWNHALTTVDFTMYSSNSFDADNTAGVGGISLLCLSCHDGTVALDSFGGATTSGTFIAGAFPNVGLGMLDRDLGSEHPISIAYDNSTGANGDPDLHPTSNHSNVKLYSGNVECASCHNVHNESTNADLLITSNAGSLMCLECHNK